MYIYILEISNNTKDLDDYAKEVETIIRNMLKENIVNVEGHQGPCLEERFLTTEGEKPHCCSFCTKIKYGKMPRHIPTTHKDEDIVLKINVLPPKAITLPDTEWTGNITLS